MKNKKVSLSEETRELYIKLISQHKERDEVYLSTTMREQKRTDMKNLLVNTVSTFQML